MGTEQNAEYYDKVYRTANYDAHPVRQEFWALLRSKIDYTGKVLELGCGTGELANNEPTYLGVDFSKTAIDIAARKNPKSEFICQGIFMVPWTLARIADTFVLVEVLEHIENDLLIVKNIPSDRNVLITVPTFDDPAHVRHFPTLESAKDRYGEFLDGEWETWRSWHIFEGKRS